MIRAKYAAIESVRDIVEPWITIWGGDEWGESMFGLHAAAHTSYGLSDEDCATVTEILLRNVIDQKPNDDEYDLAYEHQREAARTEATRLRDYWLNGGNLGDWNSTVDDARSSIEQMPNWFFKKED